MGREGVKDAGRKGCAGEDGVDAGEGFGDSTLDGGREGVGEGEGLGPDGQKEGALWNTMVEIVAETQEKRGRAGVGEQGVRLASEGTNRFAVDKAGGEPSGSVEEDGEIVAAERLGEFWRPLLAGMNGDLRAGELIAELACEMKGHSVVAANGVATGEDKSVSHAGRRASSRRWPSAACSWM